MSGYEKGGLEKEVYDKTETINSACPLCGMNEFTEIYKERGSLGIVRCNNCSLIYVNPRLREPEKIYWGSADKYFQEARLIFEGKMPHHRDKNYLADLRLIHRYKPSGNFLDIGTNMGFFLRNALKYKGWNLYGVEPSASLSNMANKYFGLNVKTAFLENAGFEDNFFDVITMTDVFEHLTEPKQVLNEVRRVLKPDGILFIKVPNALFNVLKLRVLKLFGRLKDYDIFDSYEHVVHYSHSTLKKMIEGQGFKVMKIGIGMPVQSPVWHKYVGFYYQYPCPWRLDYKNQTLRNILYFLSKLEFYFSGRHVGNLAPNITAILRKKDL